MDFSLCAARHRENDKGPSTLLQQSCNLVPATFHRSIFLSNQSAQKRDENKDAVSNVEPSEILLKSGLCVDV